MEKIFGERIGFTLIEVMVAAVILATGVIFIYDAFFVSVELLNYFSDYLSVSPWINEKLWQAQNDLSYFDTLGDAAAKGEFLYRNRRFDWDLSYSLVEEVKEQNKTHRLYRVDLSLYWQEKQRKAKLLRSAYAMYEKKE